MKSIQNAITVLLFCAVVAGVYLYLTGDLKLKNDSQPTADKSESLKTEQQFREKLAELRIDREKVVRRKNLLVDRKSETVELLKTNGITAESNLEDADTKYAVKNLQRYVSAIKDMDETLERYDKPISAIEAMLRKIEQEAISSEVAISDDKAQELGVMLMDLDERLGGSETDIFEEEELRDILGSELGESK